MPELPEVETVRRGLSPHLVGSHCRSVVVRNPNLRWPVSEDLVSHLPGRPLTSIGRRGKYLLFDFATGHLMIHLGMSGRLRIVPSNTPSEKHDHADFLFEGGRVMRYTDPRRFGSIFWLEGDPNAHPLLKGLGPEPFDESVDGNYLHRLSRNRMTPIKQFLMDGKVVVGVGNIYANEALFRAGVDPRRPAGRIAKRRYDIIAVQVQQVLGEAIEQGGTTLRDFVNGEGKPGYFQQQLDVYGREGLPCSRCGEPLAAARIGQRSTVFCRRCQR